MSATVLDPSGREVSLIKNALLVLKDKVDAPEKIPIEVAGSQEGQVVLSEEMIKLIDSALGNALEFTRQAKMRLPPADIVHSEKAYQNAKTIIGLFLREFPDKIIGGFTRAQADGFYRSSNLRDRVDAGAPHKFAQTRIAELRETGYLDNSEDRRIFKPTSKLMEELKAQDLI